MKHNKPYRLGIICSLPGIAIALSLFAYSISYYESFLHPENILSLDNEQSLLLEKTLDENYPSRNKIIDRLPYNTVPADLDISAESVILIDTATGSILYEKNAEEEIPPASMTKLVEMFVVYEAVENGEVSLDDIVPLPKECWGINMPSDASLMFLAEGQIVTLRELLLGLAIASGNDASIAVANYVAGDMESFVERMNAVVKRLGLTHTFFVESSGYSELNHTTAKEFAAFCRVYLNRYPETLSLYHSQKVLRYPLEKNLPSYQKKQGDGQAITQYNTNRLLGNLEGCDGLKTGFIYESGYNLALTAERNGVRFLSITMKGPGKGSKEGNKYRTKDGTCLMEYAFSSFSDYRPEGSSHEYTVPVPGGTEKFVKLIPAEDETLTVPHIIGLNPMDSVNAVQVTVNIPKYINSETECGKQYGQIVYSIGSDILRTIPLTADRQIKKASCLESFFAIGVNILLSVKN